MTQKPKILHFFTYISSTSTPFQKHFTSLYRATLVLHCMFWLLRCTLWLERIMTPNLRFLSLLKHYPHILIKFLIITQIKRVIPCYKKHDTSFIWYYYTYHISKAILDLDPDLCQNFLFFVTSSILYIETYMIPLSKAVHKGFISFSYT